MTRNELRKAAGKLREFLKPHRAHLGRPEVQLLAEKYVTGCLSDAHKKNAEAIALEVGDGRVRAMQRMLVSARWDEQGVVVRHQETVSSFMGSPDGILIVDDTGFRKQGVFSCGVGRQYSGTLGKIENCQVGVFLTYAVPRSGHTLIDRRLYLKEEWFKPDWAEQRERAHVPDSVVFRTKPELALEMIAGAIENGVPHSWIGMDAGYGENPELLDALANAGERYAAQVPGSTHVWTEEPETYVPQRKSGRGPAPQKRKLAPGAPASQTVQAIARALPRNAFKSAILRDGEKGPIHVQVAGLRVWNRRGEVPGREETLVVVRRPGQKTETKFILANAAPKTPHMEIAYAGLARWEEEQCFEQGKDDLGLAQYQTKTWPGWLRHTTLVMLAHGFLLQLEANGEKRTRPGYRAADASRRRTGT